MLVHFVAPTPTYAKNVDIYQSVASTVTASGHKFTRDFSAEVATQIEMGLSILDQDDWEVICRRELVYLESADTLIVDGTNKSTFGVGYQAAVALTQNKPILLLLHENSLGGSFISGLRHPLLSRQIFNATTLEDTVANFLVDTKGRST